MNFRRVGVVAAIGGLVIIGAASGSKGGQVGGVSSQSSAFVTYTGQRQGLIRGDVNVRGKEGTDEVIAYAYELNSPRDPSTGSATGKRNHKPLTITKMAGRSSPLLFQALASNETLTTVTLRLYRPSKMTGGETNFYTIKLTNATISNIKLRKGMLNPEARGNVLVRDGNGEPEARSLNGDSRDLEEVSFTFKRIEFTSDSGTTAADDWLVPAI